MFSPQLDNFQRHNYQIQCWCSPSISKNVLAHPIVGVFNMTPKCEAYPHLFLCRIPFPSTKISCGHNQGRYFLSLLKSARVGGNYLNARKPGMQSYFSKTYSYSSKTIFLVLQFQIRRPEHAPFSYRPEKLMSTPATYVRSYSFHLKSSSSIISCLIYACSSSHYFLTFLGKCYLFTHELSSCLDNFLDYSGYILQQKQIGHNHQIINSQYNEILVSYYF